MGEFLGIENSALKFVIAFVLVMALIGLTAWLIRQFGSMRPNSSSGTRNRQPRLAVLDSAVVDARRRLVLIRRDNVEHLLMIGGPTDVVVEANVVRGQPPAQAPMVAAPVAAPPPPPRHPPQQRTPIEPIEQDYDPSLVPFDEPYYEEPPAPRPAPAARPAPAMRAQAQPAAPRHAPAPRQAPSVTVSPTAPAAPMRVQPQYSDMTQRLEAALRAPAPAGEPRVAAPAMSAPPLRAEPQISVTEVVVEQTTTGEPGDVFASLEEEMANLLKPSGKNPA